MSFSLHKIDTQPPEGWQKKATKEKTKIIIEKLGEQQNLLFANKKQSLLIILQGMDASGKDGVLKNVFSHFNPRNLTLHSFDVPTEEEKAHDFLWRAHLHTPTKGTIQIFNRSYYEDVLVTRVHNWCSDKKAIERMKAINNFEHLLHFDNDTQILKFYLHVSKAEQEKRIQERINNPAKHWKYDAKDWTEISLREKYIRMYEDVFTHCNKIPWIVVPADKNWYKEFVIAKAMHDVLTSLHQTYPPLPTVAS